MIYGSFSFMNCFQNPMNVCSALAVFVDMQPFGTAFPRPPHSLQNSYHHCSLLKSIRAPNALLFVCCNPQRATGKHLFLRREYFTLAYHKEKSTLI